jgi:hypothetical protein
MLTLLIIVLIGIAENPPAAAQVFGSWESVTDAGHVDPFLFFPDWDMDMEQWLLASGPDPPGLEATEPTIGDLIPGP